MFWIMDKILDSFRFPSGNGSFFEKGDRHDELVLVFGVFLLLVVYFIPKNNRIVMLLAQTSPDIRWGG